jgi:hypothetical protein
MHDFVQEIVDVAPQPTNVLARLTSQAFIDENTPSGIADKAPQIQRTRRH